MASPQDITNTRNKVMISCLINAEFFNGIEPFRPIVDGIEFTDQPFNLFKKGKWNNDKPLVIGSNEQEMSYVSAVLRNVPITKSLFEVRKNLYNKHFIKIEQLL